jgi:hypothetical protein
MVEVFIDGRQLDIEQPRMKYVRQVNDLADVTTVNASYSYSLTINKTPNNTAIFKGLGLVGNTSDIPYKKTKTQVIDNGAMIISNGVSTISETSETYKIVIQDGIIDFFRAIENRTIGNDLDLSEISHTKTDANIIASFTNPNYRYLISEYNGYTWKDGSINPDYQVPSVNNKYLFDKIMAFAGYTYENLPDISKDWTTFPTQPDIPTDELIPIFEGTFDYSLSTPISFTTIQYIQSIFKPQWNNIIFSDPQYYQLINNYEIFVYQTANYKVDFNIPNGNKMLYVVIEGNNIYTMYMPMKMGIFVNGQFVASNIANQNNVHTESIFLASANSRIKFLPMALTRQEAEERFVSDERFLDALEDGTFRVGKPFVVNDFYAKLDTVGVEIFDFGEAFKDYSMTDFMKEIMFRKSLTPFPDVNEKHISFQTLSERLDVSNAIDWSRKYSRRKRESYDFGSYEKVNTLEMKHDESEDTFGNGALVVSNENLKDNKQIFVSKYFAPTGNLVQIRNLPYLFLELKFWDRSIKETDSGQEITYKPLNNRFYILREEIVNGSLQIGNSIVSSFPKASMEGTTFDAVVRDYYGEWGRIFDNLKIHEIELLINEYDVATLQMDRPYYFEQEGVFYLLNRLSYESGKVGIGEFLKIN